MENKKTFYGWYIVVACTILTALAMGVISSLAVFIGPMAKAMSLKLPQIILMITMYFIGQIFGSMFLGGVVQRANIKFLVLIGGLIQAALTALMAFISSIYFLYVITFCIGFVVIAVSALTQPVLINNWFKAKKGTATGMTVAGIGFAALIFAPFLNLVIARTSYHTAFLVWGLMIAVLTVTAFLIIVNRPEDKGLKAYGLNPGDPEIEEQKQVVTTGKSLTLGEAMKTPTFWLILVFICCACVPQMLDAVNSPDYMSSIGMKPETISAVLLLGGICSMLGKITIGYLFDKLGMKRAVAFGFTLGVICVGSLILGANQPKFFWVYAITYGAGLNFDLIALQTFTSRFFGSENYPTIYSKYYMTFCCVSAGFIYVGAFMIEKIGYPASFTVALGALIVAIITAFTAMATKKPWLEETAEVSK